MKRTEKEQLVTELKEKIGGAQALYYTDFTGLNVKRMTELRRRLRKAGVRVRGHQEHPRAARGERVGTRRRAAEGSHRPRDGEGSGRRRQGADRLREGERAKPAVKGGLLDGASIDAAQVKRLAAMPSREQMLAELGAGLQSPLGAFARRAERPADDVCWRTRRAEDAARRRVIPRRTPDNTPQDTPGNTSGENDNG